MRYYSCGMVRSGSTWQYNIVKEILESKKKVTLAGFFSREEELQPWIAVKDDFIAKFHFPSSLVTADIQKETGKAVYIHRQLEDVAVSCMKMKQKSLQWVIENSYLDKAWESYNFWIQQPNVLIQRYEEIIDSPKNAIQEISQYLGINLTENELNEINKKYNIENQKKFLAEMPGSSKNEKMVRKYRKKIGGVLYGILGKKKTQKIASYFKNIGVNIIDKDRLMHNEHINTGEVGYWKKKLTYEDQKYLREYIENLTLK